MNLPRLLDSSLNEVRRLNPISLGISEEAVPLTTATMTLTREQAIPIRSWVELYTANGSAGIFRTHSPAQAYGSGNDSYDLEHGICEVGDYIIHEEIEETAMYLSTAIARLWQSYGGNKWQLGSVCNGDVVVSESYQNLLQCMNSLIAQVEGAYMTFNFSTTPWTLNIEKMDTSVSAEGRLSRNVGSAVIKRNDTNLCTRVSMDSLGSDVVDADTISTWGVIEHRLTGELTKQEAIAYAQRYLARYKNPLYTVTVNGFDFFNITGETLDRLRIGKLYRLTIPEDGVVIEKPIVALSWQDLVRNPNAVSITLGEPETTITGNMFLRYTEQRRKNDHYESSLKYTSRELTTLFTKTGVNNLGETETLYTKIGTTAAGVLVDVSNNYYKKQTKVGITADGIDIKTGGTISIASGGTLNVDTANFKVKSASQELIAGNWRLNNNGLSALTTGNKRLWFSVDGNEVRLALDGTSSAGAADGSLNAYFCLRAPYYEGIGNEAALLFAHSSTYGLIGHNQTPVLEGWFKHMSTWNFHQMSSRNLKHDINDMPDMGEIIDALKPVTYRYNEYPEQLRYGLIYEDTLPVLPEICTAGRDGNGSINYVELISVLLKEVQNLRKRVAELERRVADV